MITHDHDRSNFAGNLNYPIIRSSKKIPASFRIQFLFGIKFLRHIRICLLYMN